MSKNDEALLIVIENMLDTIDILDVQLREDIHNKAAMGRARKTTLLLAKQGKDFRQLSIDLAKE